jgi:hypothetical protein
VTSQLGATPTAGYRFSLDLGVEKGIMFATIEGKQIETTKFQFAGKNWIG